MGETDDIQNLKRCFRSQIDTDGDGALDKDELASLLRRGNPDISMDEVDVLFKAADKDKSGKLCFDEFVDFIFGEADGKGPVSPAACSVAASLRASPTARAICSVPSPSRNTLRPKASKQSVRQLREELLSEGGKLEELIVASKAASHLSEHQLESLFSGYKAGAALDEPAFISIWSELGFQQEYAKSYFIALDTTKCGKVGYQDLLGGLTILSGTDARSTAELLMKVYDVDGTGSLERIEFAAALAASHQVVQAAMSVMLMPMMKIATGVSQVVATEGGSVPDVPDAEALMDLVGELPIPPPEDFGKAFSQLDKDHDGHLSLDELTAGLRKPHIQKWLLPQLAAKDVSEQMSEGPCCIQ